MASFSSSISSPAVELQEGDMDKYLQKLQPYTFIQEQGFNPLMRNCKGIWENATEREWTKFCLPSEKPTIILMVRGVNVPVTGMCICQFYDTPYYYHDYLYKIDLKELNKYRYRANIEIFNGRDSDVYILDRNNNT
ncbi:hypothetical protein Golob_007756 [Gossypium lobatum]|uniref:Uncharacterized protein n=1 Tax=Gossypium lobatum TaxID=34289 RepID=A0A7J8MDM7_9ROSI|nr:hypothetical protein [Gossypium lobatum]